MLGSGKFSKVFLATDKWDPDMYIAIKQVSKLDLPSDAKHFLECEMRLIQEVDHPNVVKYYETYDAKDHIFICMELLTGGDLEDMLANTVMTERAAASILFKLLKAVNHLHEAGVIHRDIKPSNVMFNDKGEVKLIDFSFSIIRRQEQVKK